MLGKVDGRPLTIRARNGAPCVSFRLVVTEPCRTGRPWTVTLMVEAWGKYAEQASALVRGMLVLVTGKLGQRKVQGGAWRTYINALEITTVDQAAQVETRGSVKPTHGDLYA
jgi:single-stranded DNA-binding protein